MTCAHFDPGAPCCEAGVNYLALASGGIYSHVMRLPCIPISNRRGEVAQPCNQFKEASNDEA